MTVDTSKSPFRAVSAWAPLLLAGAALAVLGGYLLTGPHDPNMVIENGVARQDEGPAARVWQLIMGLQILAIAVFAVRWMPRSPRPATLMLGVQGLALVASALPIFILES